jgi:hypothetical protein
MMEAVRTSETSIDYHFTRQYIPEDNSEQKCFYYTFIYKANNSDMSKFHFIKSFTIIL